METRGIGIPGIGDHTDGGCIPGVRGILGVHGILGGTGGLGDLGTDPICPTFPITADHMFRITPGMVTVCIMRPDL